MSISRATNRAPIPASAKPCGRACRVNPGGGSQPGGGVQPGGGGGQPGGGVQTCCGGSGAGGAAGCCRGCGCGTSTGCSAFGEPAGGVASAGMALPTQPSPSQ